MSATGGLFVVAFVVGLALLSDELGAFGDSDGTFVEHFSSGSQRGADIAGSVALAVAAAAFMYFTHLIASAQPDALDQSSQSGLVRTAGMLAGAFMFVAALALVTVPLSISVGELFDEDGGAFGEGQAVLPQFGFVALVFGAMLPAAVTIAAVARLGSFPRWLTRASFPIAVLLALSSGSVVTMALLPIWVALSTVALTRTGGRAFN
ncbi:MAG: hypothetical protein OES13_05670 [Acidimicrobiia bacterium]|nr:hypothetical protein [Acidimicrobiia bacterium]